MSTGTTMLNYARALLNAELAETTERVFFCVLCVLCVLNPTPVNAAPPVRTMYSAALLREQTVRPTLAAADATPAVLTEVRAVVAAYEAVVRQYPASGYSDDALWQAGQLSLDAFVRFGQAADKASGVRLLRRLATSYPTSRFVKQVPDQLARVDAADDPSLASARPKDRALQPKGPALQSVSNAAPSNAASATGAPPNVGAGIQHAGAGLQAGPPSSATRLATIKDIRRSVLPDAVRVTIELDSEVPFHEERIGDPARVFVDLPGTRAVPSLVDQTIRFEGDADFVRQVRVGRHPNNLTRVVLDAGGITSYSVYPLYSPYRIVIDCVRAPTTTPAVAMANAVLARVPPAPRDTTLRAPALVARALPDIGLRKLPTMSPKATTLLAAAAAGVPAPPTAAVHAAIESAAAFTAPSPKGPDAAPPVAAAVPPRPSSEPAASLAPPSARQGVESATTPPAYNVTGGLSIARQLGLGVSRIVIDPGHGGHDPGAKGKSVSEAELVLDVALRLEKLLQKVPGVEVILTRRTDEFIPLPERTAIANREGADLFLSIHANAAANVQAHGIETYFLNFANNQSAAAVAARENAASTQAMGGLPDFVKAIAMNNKLDESRDFALHVQRAMVERQKTANKTLKDLGVKQAPFVVLIGANMPSVLAEMGFVTNTQEARLLKGNAYRQRIAESLFNAIRKYQTSLKNVSTVAHQ